MSDAYNGLGGIMTIINENYLKLMGSYFFSEIGKRVNKFTEENPDAKIIRLGIGDVTRPLAPALIEAMHKAVDEMAEEKTFRGYGPEQGYSFLIEKIIKFDYESRGIKLGVDEVFVSDGSKTVSYTHLRAHETRHDLVCRLLLEKKKTTQQNDTRSAS